MSTQQPQDGQGQQPHYGRDEAPTYVQGQQPQYGQGQQPTYGAPPTPGYGSPFASAPTPYASGPAANPYSPAYLPHSSVRPGVVMAGAVLAIVGSVITMLLALAIIILGSSNSVMSQVMEEGGEDVSPGDVEGVGMALVTAGVIAMVWCAVVIVLAILVLRGSMGSAVALAVMGGLATVASLVLFVVSLGFGFLLAAAASAASACLVICPRSARQWYRAKAGLHA